MPRAGLTPDSVVACAGELADRDGYDSLSLAAVAARLGVRLPSLYKHVSGLSDVQRRVALEGLRGLDAAVRGAAVGRAGGDALRAVGAAYRTYAHQHPGHYVATLRAPGPDDEAARALAGGLTELMLAVMRGYGIDGDDAVHAVRFVRAALHGFVALEHAGGFGLPYDVDASFDGLLGRLDVALRASASP
jgi:AcrR family transcriptional regulator